MKIMRLLVCLLVYVTVVFPGLSYSEVLERVVAIVNEEVILLSEFSETYEAALLKDKHITRKKVLNDMVDRLLLLNQAKKFRLGGIKDQQRTGNEDSLLRNYIDRRIKILIHIPFDEIEKYYNDNIEQFPDDDLFEVKDEIEKRLAERALKVRLLKHIKELRGKSFIRLQL